MGAGAVLHRPILRSGAVIGYLWANGESAGFWPRAGADADDEVRQYWLRWLARACEEGLTPWEALSSWNPRGDFPHGAPAIGAPNEMADLDELCALAEGEPTDMTYGDDTQVPVQHYQVIRGANFLGRLWASVAGEAAGFLPSPDLPATDPAALAWPHRMAETCAAGLTPGQALHALREFPDDGASGHLTDPLGQGYLRDLRR